MGEKMVKKLEFNNYYDEDGEELEKIFIDILTGVINGDEFE